MKKDKNPKSAFNPDQQKQAKYANSPVTGKKPSFGRDPNSCLQLKPAWQFNNRDIDHHKWGWGNLSADDFMEILNTSLCKFETMTWDEILKTSGGRKDGNNHHNVEIASCCSDAQKRLLELKMDDIDQLFSLRLDNKTRLWGIKDGGILRFLWFDKEHSVYPSSR